MRSFLRVLGRQKRFLVLLVDEFENVLQTHPSYTEQERTDLFAGIARNGASAELSIVVATRRRLSELGANSP